MRFTSLALALSCAFVIPNLAKAELAIGYDVQGTVGTSSAILNGGGTAVARTFGGNLFGLEGFTNPGAGSDLQLTPSLPVPGTNIFRFGFDAVGGFWDITEVDFFTGSGGGTSNLLLRANVTEFGGGSSTVNIGGFVNDDGTAEDFTGLSLNNVASVEFEVVLLNANPAPLFILGTTTPSGADFAGVPDINIGIAGTFTAVPEPTGFGVIALAGVVALRRRRR